MRMREEKDAGDTVRSHSIEKHVGVQISLRSPVNTDVTGMSLVQAVQ